jgi:FtsZ-binding cell division protein ZapB
MAVDKKRINAYIPITLCEQVEKAGYGITEAITEGLELLLHNNEQNVSIDMLQAEITELKEQLRTAPNPEYLTELHAHNDTLKQDLQDLKAMHNNYMLQVQTLINQKAIEAPNPKRQWWKLWKS